MYIYIKFERLMFDISILLNVSNMNINNTLTLQ